MEISAVLKTGISSAEVCGTVTLTFQAQTEAVTSGVGTAVCHLAKNFAC